MVNVVEAEAALHAEALVIGQAVAALDAYDRVVANVIGELTAHAAIRTYGFDLAIRGHQIRIVRRSQRAGRASLHAFTASHAGGLAHRVIEVEDDLRVRAAEGVADDVVDLLL